MDRRVMASKLGDARDAYRSSDPLPDFTGRGAPERGTAAIGPSASANQ